MPSFDPAYENDVCYWQMHTPHIRVATEYRGKRFYCCPDCYRQLIGGEPPASQVVYTYR